MQDRIYNFSPGPSVLPEPVLKRAQTELLNYHGSGMSVMEMSHRSAIFEEIFSDAKAKMKEALQVPDSHEILFLQGGATLQFAAIPMNLMEGAAADYAVTGSFSEKAAKEAEKYGTVHIACSTKESGHDHIPPQEALQLSEDAKYFYYCANNTIYGTEWQYIPETKASLVCDMSSDILTKPVPVEKYGLIYAGAQKNMAPAGLTVVIVDKRLAGREQKFTPQIMSYETMIRTNSMLNTPPCWCIYMLGLVCDWLESQGGLAGMEKVNVAKANMLYQALDESKLFTVSAEPGSRSFMNVTFRTGNEDLDAKFVKESADWGFTNLKGHRSVGGMRASIYNAVPVEGVEKLCEFIRDFDKKN